MIHGKNKGRSDSACAYQTENGSFTDVYIKPVEDDRGENRLQLRQDTVADGGKRRTRVVGTFPDGNSALMLVTARLKYVADSEWGSRRYLDVSLLDE